MGILPSDRHVWPSVVETVGRAWQAFRYGTHNGMLARRADQPYYLGYNVDGFEVSLAPGDVAGGPVAVADVEDFDATRAALDFDATRAALLAAGATERRSAPRQVAPEARVCVLADVDGNPIGLSGR